MGSHGAVGKGGGGKEKGNPGIAGPGAAAAVAVSAVDEVGWLEPGGNKHTNTLTTWIHAKHSQSGCGRVWRCPYQLPALPLCCSVERQ